MTKHMSIPFAINGLGRIGRTLARVAHARPELTLVAVNDLASPAELAHLLAHDSIHGRFPGRVAADGAALVIDGRRVAVFQEPEPGAIPWGETPARLVVEATGRAVGRSLAAAHLRGQVEKVVISAPAADADAMLCHGVNEGSYDPARHHVVSNASCTTHCLALVLSVLHREFGVRQALMTEIHSYTANQSLVDGLDGRHQDPRRARAAALNIVPTTTGAPAAVELLLPELAGRVVGQAVRVPTPDVALLDLVVACERPPGLVEVLDAFTRAAAGRLRGLLGVSEEPLVSSDYVGDPRSAVVDLLLTQTIGRARGGGALADGLCRVVAWYDNEWGYAHRLADVLTMIGGQLR